MTQIRRWRMLVLSLLVLFVAEHIRGQESPDKSLSPYFLIEGGGTAIEAFPLKSTDVAVNISGVIADVLVTQTYVNEGTEPINARYVFPGSTRASVHGMRIKIGDEVVVAKIRERRKAQQEFETAKAQGKSASLLEQKRPNVFTMSVANILPQDRIEVELHYTELLIPTEGTYEFVYPTVVGPRYSNQPKATAPEPDRWTGSPYLHAGQVAPMRFDIRVTLSTGIPLREATCASHPVNLEWDSQSVARVTLADPSDFGGNRDFILHYKLAGHQVESGLLLYQGEKENFFLMMVQPPEQVRTADIPPREYVFVLDVSGSMQGFPLDTAKSVIKDLISHLRETDRFNVVLFSGDSLVMSPSSLAANEANVRHALRLIDQRHGGGGTEIVPALKTALALPREEKFSRIVVVITDGFIEAESDVFEVIQDNLNRTNFFSFGIGSGVNRYLVEGMAHAGGGEPFVVTAPGEAAEAAERFRRYIESPVLTNLQVVYRGFDAYDVEPPTLPDLFAQRPIVLFGKWRGRPAGDIEVSGEGGAKAYDHLFRVAETKSLPENGALRYLWARARIARLSDFNFGREDATAVDEVTSLGLDYSLLTKHTSFIAVVEKIRNPEANAKGIDQPSGLPQGVSDLAVGGEYEAGPEPELWMLLTITGLLISLAALWRRGLATKS